MEHKGRGQESDLNPTQQELEALQRQFRMMELNRKASSNGEAQNAVRMQRQQIEKLKKDNERLKEDLALETRQAKQANNMSASAQIAKLQDQADMYMRKKTMEQSKIDELNAQVNELQQALLDQRQAMNGINAAQERDRHIHRQIRIRENRLDKAKLKYNEATSYNAKLNATIGNLRRERVVFDGIHVKLKNELNDKKKKMAEVIIDCSQAYEARNQAQAEMVALKLEADKQRKTFQEEWDQLGRLVDADRATKEMLMQREASDYVNEAVDPVYLQEASLKDQVQSGKDNIKTSTVDIHNSMEKVQSYEKAFAKIQKETSITDIDRLVEAFTNAEDANFSLFNYVNDLSNEIERLEENCAKYKEEAKKYQVGGASGDVRAKKLIVGEMTKKLSEQEAKATAFNTQKAAAAKKMEVLKTGIAELFTKVNTDEQSGEVMANAGVTEGNMMTFLGGIEGRISELIQIYKSQQETTQDPQVQEEPGHITPPPEAVAETEAEEAAEEEPENAEEAAGAEEPAGAEEEEGVAVEE